MIKNLIFDFGKVLVNYDFTAVISPLFATREEKESFERFLSSPAFVDECDLEMMPFAEIIRQKQLLYPQWKQPLQHYLDHYHETVTGEMPHMRHTLQQLRQQGYRLYGLTNWCSKVHEVMERFPIFRLLDGQVISSEEHLLKPDVAIYQRLLSKYKLKAEECLFADDKQSNVEGAIKAGMHAVTFTTAENYLRLFNELKIKIG